MPECSSSGALPVYAVFAWKSKGKSGNVPEDAPMSANLPVAMSPKRVAEPLVRENKRVRKAPERLPGMMTGATAVKAVRDSTKGRHPIHKV